MTNKKIIPNLEKFLKQLNSDEAKVKMISRLLTKRIIVTDYLNNSMDDHEKAGRFVIAARIAEEAGLTKGANQLYVKAIDMYEKAGWFVDAAYVAEEAGLTERAIEVYEKVGRFDDAADVAKKAGLTERAEFYKTLEKLLK